MFVLDPATQPRDVGECARVLAQVGDAAFPLAVGEAPGRSAQLGRQARVEPQDGVVVAHPAEPGDERQPGGQRRREAKAERDALRLAASDDYMRADYRLVTTAEGDGLVFDLEDKPWGPNYLRIGLDLSTDFRGDSGFNIKISHNRHWLTDAGTEWRNRVQIGAVLDRNGLRPGRYYVTVASPDTPLCGTARSRNVASCASVRFAVKATSLVPAFTFTTACAIIARACWRRASC